MPCKYDNFGKPLEGTIWFPPITPKEAQMFTGRHKRFAISFTVRDAEAISDAQVREGIQPPVVAEKATLEEALAWCRAAEQASYEPNPIERLKRS
jgi:hypothetical protein